VTNSAAGDESTALARYELISLYGIGLGPDPAVTAQLQNNAYPTSIGGVQVLVGGTAAPLLYAGPGQINAIVPSRLTTSSVRIDVVTPTGTIQGPTLPVADSAPGIFVSPNTGMAAALNQDGTVNSPANPAAPGSIVSLFATGGGANFFPDGSLVPIGIYAVNVPVWAVSGLRSLEVQFAGDAPGLVVGVMQINIRIPDALPPGETFSFNLIVDGVSTSPTSLAVQ
jgi:uncharacterized protein (TIGR03437 family)